MWERTRVEIPKDEIEASYQRIQSAVSRSQHREVIREAATLADERLDMARLQELVQATWSASKGLLDGSEGELQGYALVVKFGDRLLGVGARGADDLKETMARALVNKGETLEDLGRNEEAIAIYDEVLDRFGEASEPEIRQQVARAQAAKDGETPAKG